MLWIWLRLSMCSALYRSLQTIFLFLVTWTAAVDCHLRSIRSTLTMGSSSSLAKVCHLTPPHHPILQCTPINPKMRRVLIYSV